MAVALSMMLELRSDGTMPLRRKYLESISNYRNRASSDSHSRGAFRRTYSKCNYPKFPYLFREFSGQRIEFISSDYSIMEIDRVA